MCYRVKGVRMVRGAVKKGMLHLFEEAKHSRLAEQVCQPHSSRHVA